MLLSFLYVSVILNPASVTSRQFDFITEKNGNDRKDRNFCYLSKQQRKSRYSLKIFVPFRLFGLFRNYLIVLFRINTENKISVMLLSFLYISVILNPASVTSRQCD